MGYVDIDWKREGMEDIVHEATDRAEAAFIAAEGLALSLRGTEEKPVAELVPETGSYLMFIDGKPVSYLPPVSVHTALKRRSNTVRGYAEPKPAGSGVHRLDTTLNVLKIKIDFRTGETEGLSSMGWIYESPDLRRLLVLKLGIRERGGVRWSVAPYPNPRGVEV